QELRQNTRLATEEGSVGSADEAGPRLGWRFGNVPERIDVEGPDQAWIQTLEVERQDVVVQAGQWLQDRAAGHHVLRETGGLASPGGPAAGRQSGGAHARRHVPAPPQLVQVEKVERGDARPDPVERHAGQTAPSARQIDEPRLVPAR